MIITEFYMIRADGITLERTYSDQNYKIERDGILYDEAIDPSNLNRKYIETNILIEKEEEKEFEILLSEEL